MLALLEHVLEIGDDRSVAPAERERGDDGGRHHPFSSPSQVAGPHISGEISSFPLWGMLSSSLTVSFLWGEGFPSTWADDSASYPGKDYLMWDGRRSGRPRYHRSAPLNSKRSPVRRWCRRAAVSPFAANPFSGASTAATSPTTGLEDPPAAQRGG